MAQRVKRLPTMQETGVRSLGCEDPLEEGMATPSSIPAWIIPWTEELGGLVHRVTNSRTRLSDSLFGLSGYQRITGSCSLPGSATPYDTLGKSLTAFLGSKKSLLVEPQSGLGAWSLCT